MTNGLGIAVSEWEGGVRISLSGTLTPSCGKDQYRKITELADASGHTRFLLDARGVCARASIPEIFEFVVRTYPPKPGGRRTAYLDRPENLVNARFFEHLMQNNGRSFRLFFDEAEALEWLASDKP